MLALHLSNLLAVHLFGLCSRGSGLQENAGDGIGRDIVRAPCFGSESEGEQKSDDEISHVRRLAELLRTNESFSKRAKWWLGAELNRRHKDFQSSALPTELPSQAFLALYDASTLP